MNTIITPSAIVGIAIITFGILLYIAILQLKLSIKKDDLAYIQALIDVRDEIIFDIDCCTLWNAYNKERYYASVDALYQAIDDFHKSDMTDPSLVESLDRKHVLITKDYDNSLDYLTQLYRFVEVSWPKLEKIEE